MPDAPPAGEDNVPDSPVMRPTRSSALTPRKYESPAILLGQDMGEQEVDGDDMQMESWEIAPGRVEDSRRKSKLSP